jgi:hypothetical protein
MVTRKDYTADGVEAARRVMIELAHLLGEYLDRIVMVGGWVPELLFPSRDRSHIGSMDVDLALDHRHLDEEDYRSIQEMLLGRDYRQGRQPFIFLRDVPVGDRIVTVEVDLLAGEYEGTGKSHRHQRVQGGLHVRKARGCDIAFHDPAEVVVEGELPGGGKDSVKVQVASIVSFLVMKGMALAGRLKEKDAYDIYYCLQNYPGGLDKLVGELKARLGHALVREGLAKIAEHFASPCHVGPKAVADFEGITDTEEREMVQRDAYERIRYVHERLEIGAG